MDRIQEEITENGRFLRPFKSSGQSLRMIEQKYHGSLLPLPYVCTSFHKSCGIYSYILLSLIMYEYIIHNTKRKIFFKSGWKTLILNSRSKYFVRIEFCFLKISECMWSFNSCLDDWAISYENRVHFGNIIFIFWR